MTLYFAGAGLTKSLQRTRRVPLMMDFVRVMAEYVDNDVVLNSLVTMELGEVYQRPCPRCKNLAEEIGKGAPRASKEQRDQFAQLVASREQESIETLFERIVKGRPKSIYAQGLPTYFRYAVNQMFVEIGWGLDLRVLEDFLRRRFAYDPGKHIFVSFNYDLVLDKSLESSTTGQWRPWDGYGFEFPFYTTGSFSEDPGSAALELPCQRLPRGSGRFALIKPHGSLNWLAPQANPGAAKPDEMLLPLDDSLTVQYWPGVNTFNYAQRPDEWPRDVKIMIAPPSPQKSIVLQGAAQQEAEAIRSAEEIFVLGYSFPKTDQEQQDLVRKAVQQRAAPVRGLTIVNYGASDRYFEDVEELFEPEMARRYNQGFVSFASTQS